MYAVGQDVSITRGTITNEGLIAKTQTSLFCCLWLSLDSSYAHLPSFFISTTHARITHTQSDRQSGDEVEREKVPASK